MYTWEVIKGGAEVVTSLAAEWSALCDEGSCNDPFLRPEWFQEFVETFALDILVIVVRRKGKMRAVLPLVRRRALLHGLPVRSIRAVYNLNTPRFGLVHGSDEAERGPVTQELWSALAGMSPWDIFEARLVMQGSWMLDVLALARQDACITGVWPMDAAPFISLRGDRDGPASAADFFTGPRKHFRRELDRRLRRLGELGTVAFHVSRAYSAETLSRYLDLERRGWKGRVGTAAAQDPLVAKLHHGFTARMSLLGRLSVYELLLDGRAIAMNINVHCGSTVFHWKTTYDEAYAKFSPGNLLFRRLLTDCMEAGIAEIDFLSPATPNKRVWATGEREHSTLYIFRPSFAGRLSWVWKFVVISRLRSFKRKYRAIAAMFSI